MVKFDIRPEKTALVIVDMMNGLVKSGGSVEIPRGRELVPGLNKLIAACRKKGILIIFSRHAHRATGHDMGLYTEFSDAKHIVIEGTPDAEIYDEMDRQKDDIVVVKRIFSAFHGTDLDLILRTNEINTLIIGGLASHSSCEATARDARHRNYRVIFLSDGTATYNQFRDMGWGTIPGEEVHRVVLTIMALRNAEVLSIDEVLKRL
ncbi:cysteine hydrolase family protein [Chloroflexota bacterium]